MNLRTVQIVVLVISSALLVANLVTSFDMVRGAYDDTTTSARVEEEVAAVQNVEQSDQITYNYSIVGTLVAFDATDGNATVTIVADGGQSSSVLPLELDQQYRRIPSIGTEATFYVRQKSDWTGYKLRVCVVAIDFVYDK